MSKRTPKQRSKFTPDFSGAPVPPKTISPNPDVIPEAAPPGLESDPEAGLQPIDNSSEPSQGTRERDQVEREERLREDPFE